MDGIVLMRPTRRPVIKAVAGGDMSAIALSDGQSVTDEPRGHIMSYNGWTNYATWRINLEMFDGQLPYDIIGRKPDDAYDLAQALKDQAHELLEQEGKGLVLDYALAFISDVNWNEIAQNMISDYAEENEDA